MKATESSFGMSPRVERTEILKKGRNFAKRTYFTDCIMKKTLFWRKETTFFSYFYH